MTQAQTIEEVTFGEGTVLTLEPESAQDARFEGGCTCLTTGCGCKSCEDQAEIGHKENYDDYLDTGDLFF